MSKYLPEELWMIVLDIGIRRDKLDHKDLCSLSSICKQFDTLSSTDSLWSQLLYSDFPHRRRRRSRSIFTAMDASWRRRVPSPNTASAKTIYKIELECERDRQEFYDNIYKRLEERHTKPEAA
ncbi:hypothetical protein ACFE04_028613 [Oxalis oulophora]